MRHFCLCPFSLARAAFRSRLKRQAQIKLRHELYKFIVRAAFFTPPFAYIPHDAFRTPLSSRRFPHAVRATSENLNDGILSMSFFARPRRFSRSEFLAPLSSRRFPHAVRATSENLNDGILSMSLFARSRRFSRSEFLAPLSSRCFSCAVCGNRKRRTSFTMSLYYNCFYYPVPAKLLPRTITPR